MEEEKSSRNGPFASGPTKRSPRVRGLTEQNASLELSARGSDDQWEGRASAHGEGGIPADMGMWRDRRGALQVWSINVRKVCSWDVSVLYSSRSAKARQRGREGELQGVLPQDFQKQGWEGGSGISEDHILTFVTWEWLWEGGSSRSKDAGHE